MKVTTDYLVQWVAQNPFPGERGRAALSLHRVFAINKKDQPAMGFTPRLLFHFVGHAFPVFIYCYYNMREIQSEINSGGELYWKTNGTDLEISIRNKAQS